MENNPGFKSGFVAMMGRPNVGKSTLLNSLIGTKIAAVSPWPQTTRHRQMGILTLPDSQIIFVDTPGIHSPIHKLGERMNQEASGVLNDSDVVLFLVDITGPPTDEDRLMVDFFVKSRREIPSILALNKIDLVDQSTLSNHQSAFQNLVPASEVLPISALMNHNLDSLVLTITRALPENPPYFPDDQLTDTYERDIAADLIREAVLVNLRAEVPHSIAVRIDEYRERDDKMTYIGATLFVERDSQKGIVIGQGGAMLKKIGIVAREEIESISGRKIYLRLRVKVRKNWRNDEAALRLFGFRN
jgi:GTP-binding protein Era